MNASSKNFQITTSSSRPSDRKCRWGTSINLKINKSFSNSPQMLDKLKGNFFKYESNSVLRSFFFILSYIRSTVRMGRDYAELASKVGRPSGYNT